MENLVVCTGAWLGLCSLIWLDYLTTEQNHIVTMYIIPVILIIVKQATISSHYAHIQIHIQTVFLRLLDPQFLHQASQLVYYLLEFLPNNAPGPDDTSFPDVCWVLTFHFQTAFHIPRKWTQTAAQYFKHVFCSENIFIVLHMEYYFQKLKKFGAFKWYINSVFKQKLKWSLFCCGKHLPWISSQRLSKCKSIG